MLKRCFLCLFACILAFYRVDLTVSAMSADICFYLSAEKIGDHVKVTLSSKGEHDFCGALISLAYDDTKCRYSHCITAINAHMTVSNALSGRIDILIDGIEDIHPGGDIACFYFRTDEYICGFSLVGEPDRSVVVIDSGKVRYITAELCGTVYKDNGSTDARTVGIQEGERKVRVVGVSNGKYRTGFDVYRICLRDGIAEHMMLMSDMYLELSGTKYCPSDFSGNVFFASSIDIQADLTCLIIRPFEIHQGSNIYGEENILLFYNGGYYG